MTKSKSTTGNWIVEQTTPNTFSLKTDNPKRPFELARIFADPYRVNGMAVSVKEAQANAKLIEVAPEMKKELESSLKHLKNLSELGINSVSLDKQISRISDLLTKIDQ